MNAASIATTAASLVSTDRADSHGDMLACHLGIAAVWTGILHAAGKPVTVTAHDVANMMEGLKIARRYSGAFNADDYIDGAGYAAVAGEIASRS